MTIHETKRNSAGDVVGRKQVDPLGLIDVVIPGYVIITGSHSSAVGRHVPSQRRIGMVMDPDPHTGEDVLLMMPGEELLVGDRINRENLMVPSGEPGMEIRVTSTPNNPPERRKEETVEA